ncbi:MAG: nucleotidyl transferase [Verrucomicrobia bacterium]|nr:nucleotidyl transferase [Verrucomicrobiota bacterium]
MQVVILAGGLGTRLKSVAPETAKAMVPVAGRPFIEHQFALLRKNGISRILLCIGHLGEQILNHVGDGSHFGVSVSYSHEDPHNLLGTGGALLHALNLLDSEFLMMYGDSYLPVDMRAMLDWNQRRDFRAVMSVYRNEGRWDASNVRVTGDRVAHYSKQAREGECDHIDYGLSFFKRDVIAEYQNVKMPLDLAKIQADLVGRGELGAYTVNDRFYEIGKPDGLAELDRLLREENSRAASPASSHPPKSR